jgi:molybdopterin molybdotransferase
MIANVEIPQRIARLTPLADVIALIEKQVQAVAAREAKIAAALGRTLAEDIAGIASVPEQPVALRDGFAVRADLTVDASAYAPVPLPGMPQRLEAGEALPAGFDAVAPLDAVVLRDARAEIVVPVVPGEGVIPAAAHANVGGPLRRAGEQLRAIDLALLAAVGIDRASIREPRIRLVHASRSAGPLVEASLALIENAAVAQGAAVAHDDKHAHKLADALQHERDDAVIAIGGTGIGRNDQSVETLKRVGRVVAHGIAISPGETTAFGFVDKRPVLLLPGRPDAAFAAWLAIGRDLIARLCGCRAQDMAVPVTLSRKITSSLGITDLVPVRCDGEHAEPLATGFWPLQALTQADGWIAVPANSEGYPAGARVIVRPFA